MVIDGDMQHHHDDHRLVDIATLWEDIVQTFATFSTFLETLGPFPVQNLPMQPTTTTKLASIAADPTPVSTDDDNVPCISGCQQSPAHGNTDPCQHSLQWQSQDLLALQCEIQQFTDKMQAFFALLHESLTCNNNKSSGWLTPSPLPADLPTVNQPPFYCTKPVTLSDYLSHLYMATCYIPTWWMQYSGQTASQHLQSTQQHMILMMNHHHSLSASNTCTHQHNTVYKSLPHITKHVPYSSVDGVPPAHLDCPPDQSCSICILQHGTFCNLPCKIQFADWPCNTLYMPNQTVTNPLTQHILWPYSDCNSHAPAMHQRHHFPTCCHNDLQDLWPP